MLLVPMEGGAEAQAVGAAAQAVGAAAQAVGAAAEGEATIRQAVKGRCSKPQ
jgi:hypothetical protein